MEMEDESSSFEHRFVIMEPGPEFKARYEVQEELGKGRFGVVHKVVDKETNQKLAAKFIKCRTQKDKEKVQDEIEIMNLLRNQKLLQLAAAFENPKDIIMVMEYISGGELFERVVADDFTLTEKDCILFMRQICEGVAYMHSQNVVHLDLKPENIMCHTRTSHEIKIIDFGLAQKINPSVPVRVLFGTPEFIPPEIINYEPIGVESDMWSLGVICYVLLSGLSPFMGDTDSETFANITRGDYDFDDEAFNAVSQDARDFIGALLVNRKEDRLSAEQCLKHVWLDPENHQETVVLSTDKLKKFIIRRKWQKTGNAIRALGRMATLSASRRNSANSNPNTPRPSISGSSVPRMSSLEEEKLLKKVENEVGFSVKIISDSFDENDENLDKEVVEDVFIEEKPQLEDVKETENHSDIIITDTNIEDIKLTDCDDITDHSSTTNDEITLLVDIPSNNTEIPEITEIHTENIIGNIDKTSHDELQEPRETTDLKITKDIDNIDVASTKLPRELSKGELYRSKKEVKARACSERSDSGISDCSTYITSNSCNSTPLLAKKFPINEEGEYKYRDSTEEVMEDKVESLYVTSASINLKSTRKTVVKKVLREYSSKNSSERSDDSEETSSSNGDSEHGRKNGGRLESKIESFTSVIAGKSKPAPSSESLRRLPIYTSRTVAGTIRKFDHQRSASPQPKPPSFEKSPSPVILLTRSPEFYRKSPNLDTKSPNIDIHSPDLHKNFEFIQTSTPNRSVNNGTSKISSKITNFEDKSISRTPQKSFDSKLSTLPPKTIFKSPLTPSNDVAKPRISKIDRLVQKLEKNSNQNQTGDVALNTASPTVRYRSPSPSLLRKTQAVINKEKCNEFYKAKHGEEENQPYPKSPSFSRRNLTGKNNDCFQKVSAFWNSPKT